MQLTADDLANSKIDRQKDNEYLQVYFPSAIAYGSDNFTVTCRIKVNECSNTSCPFLMTEIQQCRSILHRLRKIMRADHQSRLYIQWIVRRGFCEPERHRR
jgi:hypothetical protein